MLRVVASLGGSAQGSEIVEALIASLEVTPEQLAVTYPGRPKSVLIDRMDWARSYAKLGGALDSPQRGLSYSAISASTSSPYPRKRDAPKLKSLIVLFGPNGVAEQRPPGRKDLSGQVRRRTLKPGSRTATPRATTPGESPCSLDCTA
jgi:restriction endonuclease Mrr